MGAYELRTSSSSIYRLQLALLLLFFACAAIAWPHLPARIPTHFDFGGRPNRRVATTWISWFGLPSLAVAMTLFLFGIDRLLLRSPELWNVPDRERFLKMSPAERAPVEAAVHRFVAWCAVLVTCAFIGAQLAVYRSVEATALPAWIIHGLVWAPVIVVLILVVRMTRYVRAQITGARSELAPNHTPPGARHG